MTTEAESIDPSSLALILGVVVLVWVLTAAIVAFAARRHRATRRFHCPWVRRDVDVESDEWDGRLLDVRHCSGLHPSTDFELCGKSCLDLDELAAAPGRGGPALAAHDVQRSGRTDGGRKS